jgi:hypothetical protein
VIELVLGRREDQSRPVGEDDRHRSPMGILGESGSGCHADLTGNADRMRRYLYSLAAYYAACIKQAHKGSFKFANSYRWIVGGLAVSLILWLLGYKMEIPNSILGGVVSGGILFSATWLIVLIGRLLLLAPFELQREATQKAENAETRRKEAVANPHILVVTDRDPVIMERENMPDADSNTPGIFIIFRDFRIINRGTARASLEFELRIVVDGRLYMIADQLNAGVWDALMQEEAIRNVTGQILPKVLNIDGKDTIIGVLIFFIPMRDITKSVVLQILERLSQGNVGDMIANHCGKAMVVTDHLSGQVAEFDVTRAFSYIFRRETASDASAA